MPCCLDATDQICVQLMAAQIEGILQ